MGMEIQSGQCFSANKLVFWSHAGTCRPLLLLSSLAIEVMVRELAVALLQPSASSGAHPRRIFIGIRSSNHRLLWPKGGCSKL
jgi:hypothetical protein